MVIQVVFIPCWAEASNTTDIDLEFIKGIDDSADESVHKSVYDSVYAPIPASTELDEMHAIPVLERVVEQAEDISIEQNKVLRAYGNEEPSLCRYGDLNGDTNIDSTDLTLLKRYLLRKLSKFPLDEEAPDGYDSLKAADLNADDSIDSTDLTILKRYLLRKIDKFPAETIDPTPSPTPSPTPTEPGSLSKPGNLRVVKKTSTSVTLSWRESTGDVDVSGYNIYNDEILVDKVTGQETTYTVEGLVTFSTYAFRVEAYDGSGNKSEKSDPLEVTIDYILEKDTTINGDFSLEKGMVNLNGYMFTIEEIYILMAEQWIHDHS